MNLASVRMSLFWFPVCTRALVHTAEIDTLPYKINTKLKIHFFVIKDVHLIKINYAVSTAERLGIFLLCLTHVQSYGDLRLAVGSDDYANHSERYFLSPKFLSVFHC